MANKENDVDKKMIETTGEVGTLLSKVNSIAKEMNYEISDVNSEWTTCAAFDVPAFEVTLKLIKKLD